MFIRLLKGISSGLIQPDSPALASVLLLIASPLDFHQRDGLSKTHHFCPIFAIFGRSLNSGDL